MVKLIVGVKGTGKTKQLIEMANNSAETTNGAVACIEKGTKLVHEITYKVRLVDSDEYLITDAHALYGFVSGMCASNHDLTDIYVDSALKICKGSIEEFETVVRNLDVFTRSHDINIVITASLPIEDLSDDVKALAIN